MSRSTPYVVEFFGLPGAGKTTLSRSAITSLRNIGLDVCGRTDLIRLGAPDRSATGAMRRTLPTLSCIAATYLQITWCLRTDVVRSTHAWGKVAVIFKRWLHLRRCVESRQQDLLVLDEWLINTIWAMRYRSNSQQQLGSLVTESVLPLISRFYQATSVLYIYVDTDPALASERLTKRRPRAGRIQNLNRNDRQMLLIHTRQFFESVYEEMIEAGCSVLRVNGHMPAGQQAEKLQAWIANAIGHMIYAADLKAKPNFLTTTTPGCSIDLCRRSAAGCEE